MKELRLSKDLVALVDDEDYDDLVQYNWYPLIGYCTYARAYINGETVMLHNYLVHPPDGLLVDHKDRDGLNCQKHNMRLATRAQNAANSPRIQSETGSGYRGVVYNWNKWRARIKVCGEFIYLGSFVTKEEAARAYDTAARQHHGEFAVLNFPDDLE